MEKIVLVGAGGHAKTIVDTIERGGCYEIVGFLDGGENGREVYRGYKVIGHDEDARAIYDTGVRNTIIAVGFMGRSDLRNRLYQEMKMLGFHFPVIIDPTAVVADDAVIGEGTYIGRNAIINVDVRIGRNCIVNTAAIIEHECKVGDFSHISVASVLCGQVTVGDNVLIGANATVIQGCNIEDNCIIGAAGFARKDVKSMTCIVGNNQILGGAFINRAQGGESLCA